MSAGPTAAGTPARSLGLLAGLVGAALILAGVLSKSWWHGGADRDQVHVGVTSVETCFQRFGELLNGREDECKTVQFSASPELRQRYPWFFRLGQATFYSGIGAVLALLYLGAVVLSG